MTSEKLLKARAYEEEKATLEGRPAFHLAARVGWMNDPNGFSYYGGRYHLFYQYNPYARRWGPMHWAHAVSDDLLHWEHLPCALAPDQDYDCKGGCFSGSAEILPDGRHLLMYTGVGKRKNHEKEEVQVQCLAVGDGVNYEKVPHNPILDEDDLPEGADIHDFRDPKIWRREDGTYRAVIVSRAADGTGQVLLYASEDGLHWTYKHVLDANNGRIGIMWECPDFFVLDGKAVLLISPQDMLGSEPDVHPGNGNVAIIGAWDEESETFTEEGWQVIDDGVDYYAMQTTLAPDGRRIMIAWMQNWDAQEAAPGANWIGQTAIPREISVRDGHLYQQPIREIENLRVKTTAHRDVKVAGEMVLDGVEGRYADMEIALRPGENGVYKRFTIALARDAQHGTTLSFEPEKGLLTLDRSQSGTRRAHVHQRSCRVGHEDGEIRLRIILDRNSVEVFVGEGEKTMSMVLVTQESAGGVAFEAIGEAVMDVTMHELRH